MSHTMPALLHSLKHSTVRGFEVAVESDGGGNEVRCNMSWAAYCKNAHEAAGRMRVGRVWKRK